MNSCGARLSDWLGLSPAAVCALADGLIHPEDRAGNVAAFQAALFHREVFRSPVRLRRAGGGYEWCAVYGIPVYHGLAFAGFEGFTVPVPAGGRILSPSRSASASAAIRSASRNASSGGASPAADSSGV